MTIATVPKAYLDTCVVSGLANSDLDALEAEALLRILQARKAGRIDLVTSTATKDELKRIPAQYQDAHMIIYLLLDDVPTAPTHLTRSTFFPSTIIQSAWQEDPIYSQLCNLLPDAADAEHTFQAAKNNASFLITVDRRSFLNYKDKVHKLCGVCLVTPSEFDRDVL